MNILAADNNADGERWQHLWAQTGPFYFNFLFLFAAVCFGLLVLFLEDSQTKASWVIHLFLDKLLVGPSKVQGRVY